MASIRKLKKDINVLSYDLLSKCFAIRSYEPGVDEEKYNEVVRKIVYLRNDLILRVNHPESDAESVNLKEHFLKVKQDLHELLGVLEELKSN